MITFEYHGTCTNAATLRLEGYTPLHRRAHGELSVSLHACAACAEWLTEAYMSGLTVYTCPSDPAPRDPVTTCGTAVRFDGPDPDDDGPDGGSDPEDDPGPPVDDAVVFTPAGDVIPPLDLVGGFLVSPCPDSEGERDDRGNPTVFQVVAVGETSIGRVVASDDGRWTPVVFLGREEIFGPAHESFYAAVHWVLGRLTVILDGPEELEPSAVSPMRVFDHEYTQYRGGAWRSPGYDD
ncbi:hypothetical protein GCM10023224_40830 [Streptomonospora halophila]|uniref:Uncharacterized protein n=1 Tax=Streptomonospora halophila TaxID=427369 RepID=A0ABP9GVS5_9ACTN